MEEPAETFHLSQGQDGNHYGATGDSKYPADPQDGCAEKQTADGYHNSGFQAEENSLDFN